MRERCLSLARSHFIVGNLVNALALIDHAFVKSQEAIDGLPKAVNSTTVALRNIDVSSEDAGFLRNLLNVELQRHRALVHIANLRKEASKDSGVKHTLPLIEQLNYYPVGGVDLNNIVQYPPKLALIPTKPIFLDVAWNYIQYPGKGEKGPAPAKPSSSAAAAAAAPAPAPADPAPQKRGWFGFGR
jgi:signal recognition particle subunit SRP68